MDYAKGRQGMWLPQRLAFGGEYHCKHIRDGKIIDEFDAANLVVNQGLDHILSVEFAAAAQITSWFLGIFSGNYTPVAGDTAATFPASATESVAYTNATRPAFTVVEATQNVTNAAAPATFTFNAGATIYGGFLSSSSAKGGTGGILFSAAQFASSKVMSSGDQLLMTYSFTGSSV
jgi:hypothetical protein